MADRSGVVVVIGAGLAGLVAARHLVGAGREVVVLERADRPGGRMATLRIGDATFDVGAQFFTVRSERFGDLVEGWLDAGVAYEWCRGFGAPADGHPRYAGRGGMATIADHLADGLDLRLATEVTRVATGPDGGWEVWAGDGPLRAAAVVVTPPVPRSRSLVWDLGRSEPPPDIAYDPAFALLLVLDGPSAVPAPGGVQPDGGPLQFVADNHLKGISDLPALTVHATGEWSRRHWRVPGEEVLRHLLGEVLPWLGDASPTAARVVRWPWATPVDPSPHRCQVVTGGADDLHPVVLAGDAFAGPKVEGAALSGVAAAEVVLSAG